MTTNFPDEIEIEVTQENIDKGQQDTSYCMVALAFKDKFPGIWDIHAGWILCSVADQVYYYEDEHIDVGSKIRDFDSKRPVQPFKFRAVKRINEGVYVHE